MKIRESHIRKIIRRSILESYVNEKLGAGRSIGSAVRTSDSIEQSAETTSSGKMTKATAKEKSGGHEIIRFGDSTDVTIVYFYPGIGYGEQPFVSKQISGMQGRDGIVVVLASKNTAPFSGLKTAEDKYVRDNNLTVKERRLGGWSGGSIGVTRAISSDFSKIILADPTPNGSQPSLYPLSLTNYHGAKLLYNPSTWKSLGLDDDQVKLAKKMKQEKNPQTGSGGDHNKILIQGLEYILS